MEISEKGLKKLASIRRLKSDLQKHEFEIDGEQQPSSRKNQEGNRSGLFFFVLALMVLGIAYNLAAVFKALFKF